jgi:hypothetical protein
MRHPRHECGTVNLQREGSKAKVYQVRQVRHVLLRYGLEGEKE